MSEAGETYWRLWSQLDDLPESQLEGAEGDALCDRMDGPWYDMSASDLDEFRRRVRAKGAPPEV